MALNPERLFDDDMAETPRRRCLLLAVLPLLCCGLLNWAANPALAAPGTAVQRTWGVDARVWSVAESGGVAYLGGEFQNLMDQSGDSAPSPYLAAISLSTGQPTGWSPQVAGGDVRSIA